MDQTSHDGRGWVADCCLLICVVTSGNAVACSAAMAVLDVFKEEGVLANCQRQGSKLKAGLESLHVGDKVMR